MLKKSSFFLAMLLLLYVFFAIANADNTPPVNNLLISGMQLAGDSASITLANVTPDDVDTAVDSMVVIWYGSKDSVDVNDPGHTQRYSSVAINALQSGNMFTTTIRPIQFTSASLTMYCAVAILGRNGVWSAAKKNSFIMVRPVNSLTLKATVLPGDTIRLTWNKVTSADSVKIWRGTVLVANVANPEPLIYSAVYITGSSDTVKTFHDLSNSIHYYFGAQLFRNGLWSIVTAAATDSVYLPGVNDTLHPVNNLAVSGTFLAGDSAAVYIDSVSVTTIDTSMNSTVGVWYGTTPVANVDDALHTRWIPLSMLLSRQVGGRYTTTLQPIVFTSDSLTVYCAVVIQGKNGVRSLIHQSSFIISRPANPLSLLSTALTPSTVRLQWNAADSIDSVQIWYGTIPVPQIAVPSTSTYSVVAPASKHDTSVVTTGLADSTTYYFGAQVLHRGLWSVISNAAMSSAFTSPLSVADSMPNGLKITKLLFDAKNNRLVVGWISAVVDTGVEIGISCYSGNVLPSRQNPPLQRIVALQASDTAIVAVAGTLKPDSTYYVHLWIHKKNSIWALPTDSSSASLTIPAILGFEKVSYFSKAMDTVWAFGQRVRLSNERGDEPVLFTDTLVHATIAPDSMHGFIPVGMGFYFKQKHILTPFHVGIHCDALPAGRTMGNVRMYRYDTLTGNWRVERATEIDAVNNIVSVLVDNLTYTFIAAIDTLLPQVTVISDTSSVWDAGVSHPDTVVINDNVLNASWAFRYAKGGEAYSADGIDSGTMQNHSLSVFVTIKGKYVTQENGCRAEFLLNDGANTTIVPMSRRVIRDNSIDIITSEQLKWVPLRATADLDSANVKQVLGAFAQNGTWAYDNTRFRLYRWYSYSGNVSSTSKWVEYASTLDSLFNFQPGRLMWLKTLDRVSLRLGSGITPSLKKNCTITVPAKSWIDFSVPYDFPVRVGSIVAATNAANAGGYAGDSLQYYYWKNGISRYRAYPLYISALSAVGSKSVSPAGKLTDTLIPDAGNGYTAYNPLSVPITLAIPPTLYSMYGIAAKSLAKSNSDNSGWYVCIMGKTANGDSLSPLFCEYNDGTPGRGYLPSPPSFAGVSLFSTDSTKQLHGHVLAHGICAKDGGITYPLAFSNSADNAASVSWGITNLASLPSGYTAVIVNPSTGTVENATAVSDITLAKGETAYRELVIGSAHYVTQTIGSAKVSSLALLGTYPNPAVHTMKIRYSLPNGMQSVHFAIVDIRGRTVWQKTITENSASGLKEIVWDGYSNSGHQSVGSGMYIVRMTAKDDHNKTAGTFEKKITFLP